MRGGFFSFGAKRRDNHGKENSMYGRIIRVETSRRPGRPRTSIQGGGREYALMKLRQEILAGINDNEPKRKVG